MDILEANYVQVAGAVRSGGAGSATSTAASWTPAFGASRQGRNPYQSPSGPYDLPPSKRTTIVFGGFPFDSERETIEAALRSVLTDETGFREIFAGGRWSSVGKASFTSCDHMWAFLKKASRKEIYCSSRRSGDDTLARDREQSRREEAIKSDLCGHQGHEEGLR